MTDTDTIESPTSDTATKYEKPGMFKVLLHNDNKTTVEFVISLLLDVFHKTFDEAMELTMSVHHNGHAVAGVYTKEIAEEKVEDATKRARQSSFPLVVSSEEV